jgi:peptide chain release factor subunit 1
MGEIEEQSAIFSEVPPKVREAGWYGLSEKRIERHIDFHLDSYLKKVGDLVLRHFREKGFDWLLLGAQPEISGEMERALPSFLRQRLKKTFRIDINASPQAVLKKTLEFGQEIKREEDRALVSRLMNSLKPRGFGISGIHETLSCLHEGNVHTLLLEEGYVQEGARCSRCGFMGLIPGICPICGEKMMAVPDIVDEAVENAINRGCEVLHMAPGSGLESMGRIGAVLRHAGERFAS